MKVMFADDDEGMRSLVEHILKGEGYEVSLAEDGKEALLLFDQEKPDLVILDVMMPELNGFEVCGILREKGANVPIIMLSARGDVVDKSVGFKIGADDYLVKPFISKELLLRVEALLRRVNRLAQSESTHSSLHFGNLEIDTRTRTVLVEGKVVELANKEYQLLTMLAGDPGSVFTYERILREIWGDEFIDNTTGVTVLVHRLRSKIESDPANPRFIQTVRRVGYRFGPLE